MKRLVILFVLAVFCLTAYAEGVPVYLNDRPVKFDVVPHISDSRVSVPIREISEALGAKVVWDDTVKTAHILLGTTDVAFKIGENHMLINDTPAKIDAPASIVGNRTFVPVRALCEALGLDVWWNDSAKSVYLSEKPDFGAGHLISPTYHVVSEAFEGCVLACKTMVLSNHFDNAFTFDEMLSMNNNTVYTYWGPEYSMGANWHIILSSQENISPVRKLNRILSEIEESSGIIAQFTNGTKYHGVVITGYTPEGELLVCDPDVKSENPENILIGESCLADMFNCHTTRELLPYLYAMRRVEK
ncbi:MAG: copper amine oxidase N-terminal domain-containing protein [Clostridia bacterium]|nr:copper amine oxidase N-terminal domain-containing protein [Clostridia bacterium]